MELIQQNTVDKAYLQECSPATKEIKTGFMTECVSIILICSDNSVYGIHCGGGITGGWSDKIITLFQATSKKCHKIIVVFGVTYQNDKEPTFLKYKIEEVNKIGKQLSAECLEIYSSANLTYIIKSGDIQGTVTKLELVASGYKWTSLQ